MDIKVYTGPRSPDWRCAWCADVLPHSHRMVSDPPPGATQRGDGALLQQLRHHLDAAQAILAQLGAAAGP